MPSTDALTKRSHIFEFFLQNKAYCFDFLFKKFKLKLLLALPLNKEAKQRWEKEKAADHFSFHTKLQYFSLNTISPSFCSAKWLQLTLNLQNGTNHSCHHPAPHKIPLEEIKNDPKALHNTKFKKRQRKLMLKGERPNECDYCWRIEDLKTERISDRIYKSFDPKWSSNNLDRVFNAKDTGNLAPSYLEVSFENTCNLKCGYCGPENSSTWAQEIRKFGPYPTSYSHGDLDQLEATGKKVIRHNDENLYLEAFWQWWPELYKSLNTLRITGGEPLLSSSTWRVFEFLKDNPRSALDLAINSNLSVSDENIDRLIKDINEMENKIEAFTVFTSCEAKAEQAEYIRYGLDYSKLLSNVKKILENTSDKCSVSFMVTFNALSVTTFLDFLDDFKSLRLKYPRKDGKNRVFLMISYLRWPVHMSAQTLPFEIKQDYAAKTLLYIKQNSIKYNTEGFLHNSEVDQLERLCDFMLSESSGIDLNKAHHDFGKFFQEYDRRKGTRFAAVFPPLARHFEKCAQLNE
ncbi:MAG: twitch domain-containing radical SAM protein [Bacteriovoracaceae bacterium]